ncbi:MAG TPA: alpha/beta fold hydrolase [Gemmatimonadaceae bacterium]|nr:alpha/beta fold hydrolase [Gemmatimonadaceae bacterium]
MRWNRVVLTGGAALGAAAAYNHLLTRDAAPLENPLPGDDESFAWRGHRVAYTRVGDGPALLLVHGIHPAAWSFEWRRAITRLAARHTVYAPDLLGFGRSDRPAIRYTPRLYTALIADFAEQVIGTPCALVATALSAAYAILVGAQAPARFPALVLIGPTGGEPPRTGGPALAGAARLAIETPVVGTTLFNGLVSRPRLRRFLERSYADDSRVSEAMVSAYFSAAHQPGARHAPAAFLTGHLDADVRQAVRRLTQPALLVWGARAVASPVEHAQAFLSLQPAFELTILPEAGDLPHDERPAEFADAALGFLAGAGWEAEASTGSARGG